MNKKILVGTLIVIIAVSSIGLVSIKAMFGDEATELPGEEVMEKTLNLQEDNEQGESAEEEARETYP